LHEKRPRKSLKLKYLRIICQLHEWESQHLEVTSTQAGRYLYLNIAKQLQEQRGGSSAFLKGIYYNKDLSERALRYKIREFEDDGLIEFETHSDDKRTKKILATPELLNKLNAHSQEFSRMLGSEFLIFPKK
jgi:hypothetical protein